MNNYIRKLPKTKLSKIAEELLKSNSKKIQFVSGRGLKDQGCDFCAGHHKKNVVWMKKNTRSEEVISWSIVCDACLADDVLKKHVSSVAWKKEIFERKQKNEREAKRKAATKAHFAKLYPKKTGIESLEKLKNQESAIQMIVDLCADSPLSDIKIFGYRKFYWAHECWNRYCKKSNFDDVYWFIKIGKKWFHLCQKCQNKFRYLVERASKTKTDELSEFFDLLMDDL